jgi:hypothetical protein
MATTHGVPRMAMVSAGRTYCVWNSDGWLGCSETEMRYNKPKPATIAADRPSSILRPRLFMRAPILA